MSSFQSEEDLKLKQNLELYVERVQDPNPELQKAALESMRQEIRALTSSMTLLDRMPKRLSWLELGALEEAEKAKHYYKQRSMTRLPPNIPVTDPKPHKAPKKVAVPSHLPEKLMKLDLQCFPDAELPSLLEPGKLRMLEKLYIKGGTKLTGFGKSVPEKPTECSVKVLRLKFLPRLKVEWRELRELYFPKLEFLDKYQSPQHVGVEDPHVRALPQGLQDICSMTRRRFNSHGMIEENRGEAALLQARPVVLEMTAEELTVTDDGQSVKKARVE
ncbi:hypothetical protein F2Q70_00038135 [Brassica cretica]|uniref:RPN1 N-terminal domain-containing protein n=1 Tax=Brassica cretica TaxID=69181 RepID=A0A8S9K853_BRACR|nr:hypothetical protein F2Q70_00038135 [Brassica cretica]